MAEPITVTLIIAGILVALVGTAILFWHQILNWAERSVFPWFEKNYPSLAPLVRSGFAQLDKAAVAARKAAKEAWNKVREYLIQQEIEFERDEAGHWVARVISFVVRDRNTQKIDKITTTEEAVTWEQLPETVREAFLKQGTKKVTLDIIKSREAELATMATSE